MLSFNGCAFDGSGYKYSNLQGKIEDSIYISAKGKFKVPIPVNKQWGGTIEDYSQAVIFTDGFGALYRIESSNSETYKLQAIEKKSYLQEFLNRVYLPETIFRYKPTARIIEEYYITDLLDGAYFCIVNIPEGSITASSSDGKNYTRHETRRGLLLFIIKNRLCIVSSGLGEGLSGERPFNEDEAQRIKKQLIDFTKTIIFE